ncbi:hypothetical protein L6164_003296 [Bauhinia variegata]|uniref:Uncharacterized protein n=1 Tax=Bauhinia variegata TaxID=167791 RepID=A0ACB9Q1F7_BAUVA|nr:hypothetical protein L6164_003296 [Bauhinia variegata]
MAVNKPGNLLSNNAGMAPGLLAQHIHAESPSGVSNAGRNIQNNISIQTGEEFSLVFGLDGIAGRGIPAEPGTSQKHEGMFGLITENSHVRYEGLTNILGLKRMESETVSDFSDFTYAKEPPQEMVNGACINKLRNSQMEDGDSAHGLRKPTGDSTVDLAGIGSSGLPLFRHESSYSNGFSGLGVSDDSQPGKMKFLCSFGGKILPRPSDGKLRYVGGETHIISIRKNISWEELVNKTFGICNQPHTIKYQLPGEDLDALISVSADEDLQNMIEEYHGLERHEGSQKLRIFLIPLGESERSPSFEASTIQQSDPDYHYVVAVNGIVDRSPKQNVGGQSLKNEASQFGKVLNFAPVFQKNSPKALSPLKIKGGYSAFNPEGFFNDSLNFHRSLHQSPPIFPIPILGGGSSTAHNTQLHRNDSILGSTESNTSFITAPLQPDNSNTSSADCRSPQQVAMSLRNNSQLCQQTQLCQPEQHHGGHFGDYHSGKEFGSPLYVNQTDGFSDEIFGANPMHKDEKFHSENPFSCLDNSVCPKSGSTGITDSPNGMPHAFSDSMLHENGTRSGHCSQEGINQFSSWNLTKAQLASMLASGVSQGNPLELQHDSNIIYPEVHGNIPNVESAELIRRQDLPVSSLHPTSFEMNNPIHKDNILPDKKSPIVQTDLSGSSCLVKQGEDSSVTSETMKRNEEKNSILNKDSKPYERTSPAVDMGQENELQLLESFLASNFNANIKAQKEWEQPSEDISPASSATVRCPLGNLVSKTPSDLLDLSQGNSNNNQCSLVEGFFSGQGIEFSVVRNSDLEGSVLKCGENYCGKNPLGDLLFELSIDPVFPKPSQVESSVNLKNTGLHENLTVSSTCLHPAVHPDDCGPSSNLAMNDVQNPSKNDSFKKVPSLLDSDFIMGLESNTKKSNIEDMMKQSNTLEKSNDANQVEPFIKVDVANVASPGIESSSVPSSLRVDEIGCDVLSPSATEVESIVLESEPEDFKDDEVEKNESLSDAMIAEMEASIYGLQIIRNADLEELQELGSGTYGTVYHSKWRGSDVAIKRIKKSCFAGKFSEQERLTKDFWREAQILSTLHHPNVVAFYGIVPDGAGGTLATVTEYMVNGSLRHALLKKDRLLDPRKKLIIAMDAAFGMEYLHSKNIVHFDLKCDNLLVNLRDQKRPICKVGDFGLSRIKRNTLVSGGVRGTLPWMAPELLNGSSSRVSEKVDVFSFGISMWEILTGEEPYAEMHCGVIIGGILNNTLRPTIPERCDPEWKKLMEHCWSHDPENRPSFSEIAGRLRAMSIALQARGHNLARQPKPSASS